MEAALAKLLVDEGGIAAERLDEAVRRNAQHGGRIDTYLLELGLIDEARLTELLARAYNLPPADFRALVKVDLQALRVLPSRVAERCQIFPFLLQGTDLHVLAPGPPDMMLLEEIGEMVGRTVVPHVATEYRIARALSHFYGLPIPVRFATLERVAEGRPVSATADADVGGRATGSADTPVEAARWPLDRALAHLAAARDRDAVIDVILTYGKSFVECAALLGVHAGRAVGWQAVGAAATPESLRAMALALDEPSALRTVIDTTAPYLGKFGAGPVHDTLLEVLGRPRPRTVVLYPVLVAGRVIAIFYGDNGKRALRTGDLADLLAFCARIGAAFENVILARKRQPPQPLRPVPGADPVEVDEVRPGAATHESDLEAAEDVEASVAAPQVFTVLVDVESATPAMSMVEEETADQPQAHREVEAQVVVRADEVSADELASWDDEVLLTLGASGQRPAAVVPPAEVDLAADLLRDGHPEEESVVLDEGLDDALGFGDGTGFESGEESLPIRQLQISDALDQAMAEAAGLPPESVLDRVAQPDPMSESDTPSGSSGTAEDVADAPAVRVEPEPESSPVAQRVDALQGLMDLDTNQDAEGDEDHPDEESVVFEDLESEKGTASWREALQDTVESGHQGGEVVPPPTSVLHAEAEGVDFSEIVSEVVARTPGTPVQPQQPQAVTPRESGADLEVGTPRISAPATPASFSLADLNRLCEKIAGTESAAARQALRELVQADLRLVPMLTSRFPGRVSFDPFAQDWAIPEPDDLSPLIALLVQRPDIGAEVALAHLDSSFPALRWFAVYLFRHVHDARAIKAIMPRLHDEEPRIRHLTAEVLKSYTSDAGFDVVIKHLRSRLQSPVAEVRRRAIYFLGFFKDVSSVPHLVGCLSAREPELVAEAVQALAAITMQTLGSSQRKWLKWWEKNQIRSRVEWLIDGLRHRDRNIRYAASVELTGIARETFGYDYDGKKRDREKAAKAWDRWWKGEKKRMHIEA
ncbi:MAG: hypothetical protein ABIJ09_26920 [Pseudomonadota bacterium]